MLSLADDRSIIIKKADKGSTSFVGIVMSFILEAEKQLGDDKLQCLIKRKDFTGYLRTN